LELQINRSNWERIRKSNKTFNATRQWS